MKLTGLMRTPHLRPPTLNIQFLRSLRSKHSASKSVLSSLSLTTCRGAQGSVSVNVSHFLSLLAFGQLRHALHKFECCMDSA